jgi:hypothetical protein
VPLIKVIALLMQGYRCLKQGQTSACFALVAEGAAALERWMEEPAKAEASAPAMELGQLELVTGELDEEPYYWERHRCR